MIMGYYGPVIKSSTEKILPFGGLTPIAVAGVQFDDHGGAIAWDAGCLDCWGIVGHLC